MDHPLLLTANTTLIAQELTRAGASLPAPAPRLVDSAGWTHTSCDDEATIVTTFATHSERLCARCGYRAFYAPDGQWFGHHGGCGLIILRRPDHAGDIVLSDFADEAAYTHTFASLVTNRDRPYSLIVLSEPQDEPNAFRRVTMRAPLSDLDNTPLRAYLTMFRWMMEYMWADWRHEVFDRLSLPMPLKPGEAEFSDWDGIETGTLDDGREYTLHASAGNDPHTPWLSLNITGERRDWLPHQRSTRRPWKN